MNKQNTCRLLMVEALGAAAVAAINIAPHCHSETLGSCLLSPCYPYLQGTDKQMFYGNHMCLLPPKIVSDKKVDHLLHKLSLCLDSSNVFIT